MTRKEEWEQLHQELARTPTALDGSVDRARARAKRRLWKRRVFGVPLAGAAALFLALVVLVNVYVPFAYALSAAGLKSVVRAVTMNPSLRVALEHDYAQYVGQSQTIGDITVTVDAVIADSAQVNVFYRVESKTYVKFHSEVVFSDPAGARVLHAGNIVADEGNCGRNNFAIADFGRGSTPDKLHFTIKIPEASVQKDHETGPVWTELDQSTYAFSFDLPLDSRAIRQGEHHEIDRWITMDGQRIYVESVEVYPSHIRIRLWGDENNTALLHDLSFCLRDENGRENQSIRNGFVTSGEIEGENAPLILRQESTFFWESEHLTLCISGAQWRDKSTGVATFDLATGKSKTPLPPIIQDAAAVKYRGTLSVVIISNAVADNRTLSCVSDDRPAMKAIPYIMTFFGLNEETLPPDFQISVPEDCFAEQIVIENFPYDDFVEITWNYTHETVLDTPIEIPIK